MTFIAFRRSHARIGAPVRYLDPLAGWVSGLVRRVSYTHRTVWVTPENTSRGEVQYAERQDGLFRQAKTGKDSPPLEYLEQGDTASSRQPPAYSVQDELESKRALENLVRDLKADSELLIPAHAAELQRVVAGLTYRQPRQPAPRVGAFARYRDEEGIVTRLTSRSVWVTIKGKTSRFSRRTDGKYRMENLGNHGPVLEFVRPEDSSLAADSAPEIAQAPNLDKDAIHLPPARRDPRTAASVAKRQAAIAAREAAERADKEEQEGWDLI